MAPGDPDKAAAYERQAKLFAEIHAPAVEVGRVDLGEELRLALVGGRLVGVARRHHELGGPQVRGDLLRPALARRAFGEGEELALPVVEVADPGGGFADLVEPTAAEGGQPVELEVEAHVVVQPVDADGEVEGHRGSSWAWGTRRSVRKAIMRRVSASSVRCMTSPSTTASRAFTIRSSSSSGAPHWPTTRWRNSP